MISVNEVSLPAVRPSGGAFSGAAHPRLFERAAPARSGAPIADTDECSEAGEAAERVAWTQEEVVMLHGILFDTCVEKLSDAETPLDEVVDWLRWIVSDAGKETAAFSFANTLALYGRPHAYYVREALQRGLKRFLSERLSRYPAWVAEAFWSDPDRFALELERNPQWINETLRRVARGGDLFAA